jgi:TRAP-type C4-dicarboxylate transport system permease small subunit
MNSLKGVAIVLIAAGVAGLAYGGFTYTRRTHEAQIGSLELTLKDQRTVNVPVWAGVGAIVIGAGLLLIPAKK